jgi:hypothetical protein
VRDLTRSVVVVTGASSGIGRATALGFARELAGARVLPSGFSAGNYGRGQSSASNGRVMAYVSDPDAYAVRGGWKAHRRRELAGALLATLVGFGKGLFGGS